MLIIPAIDLKNGKVVRLYQGSFKSERIYSDDPINIARFWQGQGAKYLHVVDLDGARTGRICHKEIINKIAKSIKVPVEFGGGLRSVDSIKRILDCGVERAVLGTKSQDINFLRKVLKRFKKRIIVSVDARNYAIRISGWQRNYKNLSILELIRMLEDIGFKQIIYTDISRDGTLKGPNIAMVKRILNVSRLSIIASGGISSLSDLSRLKKLTTSGLVGVIVGKALYEGRFTLREALKYTLKRSIKKR